MTAEQLYEQMKKMMTEDMFEALFLYVIRDLWSITGCYLLEESLEPSFFEDYETTAHLKVYSLHKAGNIPSPHLVINYHNYLLDAEHFPDEQFVIAAFSSDTVFWLLDAIQYDNTEWLPESLVPLHKYIKDIRSEIDFYDFYDDSPLEKYLEPFEREYSDITDANKDIFKECLEVAVKEMGNPDVEYRPHGVYLRDANRTILINFSAISGTIGIGDIHYEENYSFVDIVDTRSDTLYQFEKCFRDVLSRC